MSRRILAVVACAVTLLLSACGSDAESAPSPDAPAALTDQSADGESLANAWFELLSMTGSPDGTVEVTAEQAAQGAELVRPFLDPAFQLQRATGQRFVRDNYVPADIDKFEVSDVMVTEPRDDLKVLRYAVRTEGAVIPDAGLVMSDELEPHLTVVRWDDELERWLIVSHASFSEPIQAVCNPTAVSLSPEGVTTSEEDRAVGEELAREWFGLLVAGDGTPLMHPEVQSQSASGTGYTTAAEYKPGQMKQAELSEFVVTRNGDLLVVTLGVVAEGTVYAGAEALGSQLNPRLLTFLQDDSGEWQIISAANFNPPAQVPEGVDCATATG